MADCEWKHEPILKGSNLSVCVEEALSDVLVVCLKHNAKVYRGVLLDTSNRTGPYGVCWPKFGPHTENATQSGVEASTATNTSIKPEMSAVTSRSTYTLDRTALNPSLVPSPQKSIGINRQYRSKNIRSMRLRPRQVLCSKCKQGVHDNTVQGNTTTLSIKTESDNVNNNINVTKTSPTNKTTAGCAVLPHSSDTCDSTPVLNSSTMTKPIVPRPESTLRMELRKRKSTDTDENTNANKNITPLDNSSIVKPSPVIKISYATPRGEGTVTTEISSKPNSITDLSDAEFPKETELSNSEEHGLNHEEYRKRKKANKKAKLKAKHIDSQNDVPKASKPPSHHKKSRHSKHKLKRKHRHKEIEIKTEPETVPDIQWNVPNLDDAFQSVEELLEPDNNPAENCTPNTPSGHGDLYDSDYVYDRDQEPPCQYKEYCIMNTDESSLKSKITRNWHPEYNDETNPKISLTLRSYNLTSSDFSINNDCDADTYNVDQSDSNLVSASDTENDSRVDHPPGTPSGDEKVKGVRPLMMRIQTKNVTMCETPDGKTMTVGDIVWGKIHGFPWWPGRIMSLTVSQGDNGVVITQIAQVSWFGSSTMSHMPCSELSLFLEEFKLRYNKKKRGPYKLAIKQATRAAQRLLSGSVPDDLLDEAGDAFDGVDLDFSED